LELQQTGLIDHWDSWFRPMPPQCNGKAPTKKKSENKLSALSFKNLTGAFLLLAVGLSLSLLVFLLEQIYYRFN
jgi:ionotropic glutamate receptor